MEEMPLSILEHLHFGLEEREELVLPVQERTARHVLFPSR